MKITTLQDAFDYQTEMVARMKKNTAATEHDHYMTNYILEIIEDRIAAKHKQVNKAGDAFERGEI